MKADPRELVRAHYGTLVDNRTGRTRPLDHLAFEGLPLAVGLACFFFGVQVPATVSAGLVTVAGLLSAFFFQALLQISQRALEWAHEAPEPSPDTSREAKFLDQNAANSGYASIVCILTAAVFVVAGVANGIWLTVFSAIGLTLGVHLVLVLLLVLVRVFALTDERLKDTRTGHAAEVAHLPKRKAG
jgi:hypothetical protein